MDPMDNVNNAADALRQVAARSGGFWDYADERIGQREGAYDALAANLKGVVGTEMFFTAAVDPDDAAPTNVRGGTFNAIGDVLNVAPSSSFVRIDLAPDKVHELTANHALSNRLLYIRRNPAFGVGANPIIRANSYLLEGSSGFTNLVYGFTPDGFGSARLEKVTLEMMDKFDAAHPWNINSSFFRYGHGSQSKISFNQCQVTGFAGHGIVSVNGGGIAEISMFNTTLDGAFHAVKHCASGVALISNQNVTLSNGALLTDGGIVGTNILQN